MRTLSFLILGLGLVAGLARAAVADDCELRAFGLFEWGGPTCEESRARIAESGCARDTFVDGHKVVPKLRCEGRLWKALYAGGVPSGSQACFDLRSSDSYCKGELNARIEPASCEPPLKVPADLERILEKASALDDAG